MPFRYMCRARSRSLTRELDAAAYFSMPGVARQD
jgi:hypothetical protein